MGFYIETGTSRGKADILIRQYGASPVWPVWTVWPVFKDIDENKALICVVDNGFFEAAAYCFSEQEFEAFNDPSDPRPRKWLIMDKNVAEKLSGYRKEEEMDNYLKCEFCGEYDENVGLLASGIPAHKQCVMNTALSPEVCRMLLYGEAETIEGEDDMTKNRFLIFLGLKWKKIKEAFGECAFVLLFLVPLFISAIIYEWAKTNSILWICMFFKVCFWGFIGLFFLLIVIGLVVTFVNWIRDNWAEAGRIVEKRTKEKNKS